MMAQKSLSSISADRDLWIAQYRQEIAYRDKISGIVAAQRRGRAEGERKKAIETARILKASNISIDLISKSTGLSSEEIAAL